MTVAEKRRLFYALSFIIGILGGTFYILYASRIFQEGFTEESLKSSVALAFGFLIFRIAKDFKRQSDRRPNKYPKYRAFSYTLLKALPWILAVVIAVAIRNGVLNLYIHILAFSTIQIVANIFGGFEEYYFILEEADNK